MIRTVRTHVQDLPTAGLPGQVRRSVVALLLCPPDEVDTELIGELLAQARLHHAGDCRRSGAVIITSGPAAQFPWAGFGPRHSHVRVDTRTTAAVESFNVRVVPNDPEPHTVHVGDGPLADEVLVAARVSGIVDFPDVFDLSGHSTG